MAPPPAFVCEVKKNVKVQILLEDNEASLKHVKELVKQGRFLELTKLNKWMLHGRATSLTFPRAQ